MASADVVVNIVLLPTSQRHFSKATGSEAVWRALKYAESLSPASYEKNRSGFWWLMTIFSMATCVHAGKKNVRVDADWILTAETRRHWRKCLHFDTGATTTLPKSSDTCDDEGTELGLMMLMADMWGKTNGATDDRCYDILCVSLYTMSKDDDGIDRVLCCAVIVLWSERSRLRAQQTSDIDGVATQRKTPANLRLPRAFQRPCLSIWQNETKLKLLRFRLIQAP
jgi:hypothetical protein